MEKINSLFTDKRICILGYGREGKSTLRWLMHHFGTHVQSITVADKNPLITREKYPELKSCKLYTGDDYLLAADDNHTIIKSPGVNLVSSGANIPAHKITSQTDIFLKRFHRQCIGVTGTKGKSTTASMLYQILCASGKEALLTGNMGKPPLDSWDTITEGTTIVCELSSHQLEHISTGPASAIFLNLYQEHLDHYYSFEEYQHAKFRIASRQQDGDLIIANYDNSLIRALLKTIKGTRKLRYFSRGVPRSCGMGVDDTRIVWRDAMENNHLLAYTHQAGQIKGSHNVMNFMAAALAAMEAGCPLPVVQNALKTFKGLEHRLEYIGTFRGIPCYDDAIATVPEASMAAVEALENMGTLILGGQDRGVNYEPFGQFLSKQGVDNYVFMGEAGRKMLTAMEKSTKSIKQKVLVAQNMDQAVQFALENTPLGKCCVLSPAAPSYDSFKDYAHKGQVFKELLEAKNK